MAPRKPPRAPKVNTGKPPARKAGGRNTNSRTTRAGKGQISRVTTNSRGETRRGAPIAKGLGGEQIEGRQAVRELLIGQKRKVREIWMAADIDPAPILSDIEEIAHAQNVVILEVPRRKLEETARSEAPQGIIAFAHPLH